MSEFTIANELARITLLSPIEFEKELLGFIESPHLLRLLADLLASNKLDSKYGAIQLKNSWQLPASTISSLTVSTTTTINGSRSGLIFLTICYTTRTSI